MQHAHLTCGDWSLSLHMAKAVGFFVDFLSHSTRTAEILYFNLAFLLPANVVCQAN